MALDLREQEELEDVKQAWHGWLKWVVLFLVIVAVLYLGQSIWSSNHKSKNEKATDLLVEFQALMEQNQPADALNVLKQLQEKYADTMPAAIATTAFGAISFYNNKFDDASKNYEWVAKHQTNNFLHVMAIIDLAKIKMQQKKFDEALKLVDEKVEAELQFLVEDLKGDIYMAKGEQDKAGQHYDLAINLLPKPNEVITEDDIEEIKNQIQAKKLIQIPNI